MIRNAAKRPYTAYLVSILALVLLTALSSLATQFVAWRFDYHPALGWPWIGAIYPPWSCVEWQVRFQAQGPRTFQMLHAGIGLIGAAAAGAALLYASLRGRKAERHEGIHGTAHWATPDEIEATGLLSGKGVYATRAGVSAICATMVPSTLPRLRQPARARASRLWCRPFCPGRQASSSMI